PTPFLHYPDHTPPPNPHTLSLHDALPISAANSAANFSPVSLWPRALLFDFDGVIVDSEPLHFMAFTEVLRGEHIDLSEDEYYNRSEEHTSELQSRFDLVCRLLLEKKKVMN